MKLDPKWHPEVIRRGPDPNVGAELFQLTSAALVSNNIYCEQRYGTTDGTRIALLRSPLGRSPEDLWVCDLRTHKVGRVCGNVYGHPPAGLFTDNLFCIRSRNGDERMLTRVNLQTLEMDDVFDLRDCPRWRYPVGTISPDERTFVSNLRIRDEVYGLYRIDLGKGEWEIFHEHQDICNPHPQFEPSDGKQILVQLNRGCELDEAGNCIRLVGDEGATLYTLDVSTGTVTYLPVGKPHTGPVTGHECWVGRSGRVILTSIGNAGSEIYLVSPGDKRARRLWHGLQFCHMAASDDGRYFIVDDTRIGRVYVGSIETGRMLPLCDTGSSCGTPQPTHPHPYMTSDNRHVILNSDSTGLAQVWAARIPEWFLGALDEPVGADDAHPAVDGGPR